MIRRLWTHFVLGAVCAGALTSCGGTLQSREAFSAKLRAGCDSGYSCHALVQEAEQRYRECSQDMNADCEQKRQDFVAARALRDRYEESVLGESREAEQRRPERAADEQRDRDTARRDDDERRRRPEQERDRQNAQRAASQEERLQYYRLMTPARRANYLQACFRDGGESRPDLGIARGCGPLYADLITVAETDAEKWHLIETWDAARDHARQDMQHGNQRLLRQRQQPRPAPGSGASEMNGK